MDPVTAAIVAAIKEGVASGAPKLLQKAASDAYSYLKDLIQRKFGPTHKISAAVTALEESPDSEGRKVVLSEEIQKANAHNDSEVMKAAELLSVALRSVPAGSSYSQRAIGNNIAQAADGSNASVTVNSSTPAVGQRH